MPVLTVRVSTININRSAGRDAWRRALGLAARRGDLVGAQEIGSPQQKTLMRWLCRRLGLRQFGLTYSPNPIFSDPDVWVRVRGSVHKLHGPGPGRYRVRWPGFNGPRYATVAIYRNTNSRAPQVAVINTHWVPRGRKVPTSFRNRARAVSTEKVASIVTAHTNAGRVVVVVGDLNLDTPPTLPGVRWADAPGVDVIGVAAPKGVALTKSSRTLFSAPIDHRHGLAAKFTITY